MAKKEQNKSILTAHQSEILKAVAKEDYFSKRFYLAGGTALSEFYLKHRLSEDLDFFTEKQEVNPIFVLRFFQNNLKKFNIDKIDTKQVMGLFTLFLKFNDGEVLKVDFNYYPFPRIERGAKFGNLEIESIHDIGIDKVHTIVLKPRARDFIDLYFIIKDKKYDFRELLKEAKVKFDWDITLIELGARLLEASKMTDFPRMIKKIDDLEWQDFFIGEAQKLKSDVMR